LKILVLIQLLMSLGI